MSRLPSIPFSSSSLFTAYTFALCIQTFQCCPLCWQKLQKLKNANFYAFYTTHSVTLLHKRHNFNKLSNGEFNPQRYSFACFIVSERLVRRYVSIFAFVFIGFWRKFLFIFGDAIFGETLGAQPFETWIEIHWNFGWKRVRPEGNEMSRQCCANRCHL